MKKISILFMLFVITSITYAEVKDVTFIGNNTYSALCADSYATSITIDDKMICTYDGSKGKCSENWSVSLAGTWACRNHNNNKNCYVCKSNIV